MKFDKTTKTTCPLCKGSGVTPIGKHELIKGREEIMEILVKSGKYSIRQIARMAGYKSHWVVQEFIKDLFKKSKS